MIRHDTKSRNREFFRLFAMVLAMAALAGVPARAQHPSLFRSRIDVGPDGLRIDGALFRESIPRTEWRLDLARIVDLDQEPGLRPGLKLYGAGLPSYHAGWFRLKDGQKAVVTIGRSNLAVYIPTNRGRAVLVGPDDPADFLDALRNPNGDRVFWVGASHGSGRTSKRTR